MTATEPERAGLVARASRALTAPVDASSLIAFRIAFGALMAIAAVRFSAHGWIAEHYLEPTHFFHYAGFGWVRPLPGAGMYVCFALIGACAVAVAIGFCYRAAALGLAVLFAYAHLCDKTNYLNHYYLLILLALLLVVLPLGQVGSVDAWRRRRRGAPVPSTLPAWPIWVLRGQLALVYVYGGVAKLQPDWLVHAQPLDTWLAARPDVPLVGGLFAQPWAPQAVSWAAAIFDLTIAGWLLWPRSRRLAYPVVIAFHLLTARLFHIGMFPWVMIALTPIFFAPDWPRRVLRLRQVAPGSPPPAPPRRRARLLAAALVAHFAVQILFPLRFLLYPGNHLWTEQGFRFAWKVMVMEKSGVAGFIVRDPDSGRTWRVPATDYWTRYQSAMMATQPDMILEAAHVIAAEFRGRGVRAPEVRADVLVSLNGRPRRRLVDPEVDLAREPDAFGPYRWLLPAPDVDPP